MLVSHLQSCWRVIDFHGRCDFWLEYYFVNIWFCYFTFSGNGTINLTNHKHSSLSVFCVKVSTVCGGKIFTLTFHVNLIWILRANFVVVLLHVFSFFFVLGVFSPRSWILWFTHETTRIDVNLSGPQVLEVEHIFRTASFEPLGKLLFCWADCSTFRILLCCTVWTWTATYVKGLTVIALW